MPRDPSLPSRQYQSAAGEMLHIVYGLVDPRRKVLFYVGITNDIKARYGEHLRVDAAKHCNPGKYDHIQAMLQAGHKPGMMLIAEYENRVDAEYLEQRLIKTLAKIDSIQLRNIEHNPRNNYWQFKKRKETLRAGNSWTVEERVVALQLYKDSLPPELVAGELRRGLDGTLIELARLARGDIGRLSREDYYRACDAEKRYGIYKPRAADAEEKRRLTLAQTGKYMLLKVVANKQTLQKQGREVKRTRLFGKPSGKSDT